MVSAFCCLHNWMIDEHDDDNDRIPLSAANNSYLIMNRGGRANTTSNTDGEAVVDESRIDHLLDGGNHVDDSTTTNQRNTQIILFRNNSYNPQEYLFHKIELLGLNN